MCTHGSSLEGNLNFQDKNIPSAVWSRLIYAWDRNGLHPENGGGIDWSFGEVSRVTKYL